MLLDIHYALCRSRRNNTVICSCRPEHKASLDILLHLLSQMLHVGLLKHIEKLTLTFHIKEMGWVSRCSHGEVVDVERVFVDVGRVGPDSYTSAGCQIATVASHGLHHKHPSLGPRGWLLDFITALFEWKKYDNKVSMKRKILAN